MNIKFQCLSKSHKIEYPPVPALQVIPEDFKRVPNKNDIEVETIGPNPSTIVTSEIKTVKNCMPMIEYLSTGYAIRLGHDEIVRAKDYAHPHEQLPITMYGKKNNYLKFYNDWVVITPEGYSCMVLPVFGEERFKIFGGVVATDTYKSPILFPAVRLIDDEFEMKAGDAIAIVFPFKRTDWTSEIIEWNDEANQKSVEENIELSEVDAHYKKKIHRKNIYK